jgi:hypothetical protein
MRILLTLFFLSFAIFLFGQYPFEKYPAIKYKEYKDWKVSDKSGKENKYEFTLTIPKFFDKKDALTIKLISFTSKLDSSYITVFRNKEEINNFFEPMSFFPTNLFEPLRLADINGDHSTDLKLVVPYMGNGTASLNVRVIYLFQQKSKKFTKISYFDKMDENRTERDFDNDGNYEIITMTLLGYKNHSYWLFNLFNWKNEDLCSANQKNNYPILIQFLYRNNYKITNKVTRQETKELAHKKPEDYQKL